LTADLCQISAEGGIVEVRTSSSRRRDAGAGTAVFTFFVLASLALLMISSASAQTSVPQRRIASLRKGVNIADWCQDYTHQQLWRNPNYVSLPELKQIRRWGITQIRLPIAPATIVDESNFSSPKNLQYLDAILKQILDAGLSVTIDIHYTSTFDDKLFGDDPRYRNGFKLFWKALAAHYSSWDAERVFFEVLNEPTWSKYLHYDRKTGGQLWWDYQREVLAAIRESDKAHTVIVGADDWNNYDMLSKMTPYDDPNVIYNFHFYDPMPFTHQGASWVSFTKPLANVPYPSNPENIKQARVNGSAQPDPHVTLAKYGEERWNANKIRSRLQGIKQWGEKYKVPLLCNEFGVDKDQAPPLDRAAWIRDVRETLESMNVGWALWDYESGSFAMIKETDFSGPRPADNPHPDALILEALGLHGEVRTGR
jgi:endoglucanase